MFKRISIENFQSLKQVDLELAPFTVIVGASDSGKSAFFRAISTLISNRRGSEFITHGERLCRISAELVQGNLTLQRGPATKDNYYEIRKGDDVQTFSKLSGTVPDEVSAFLNIPAKDPINIASQHDKPYLLDAKEYSAAESARILGALTNVNILFEGARESNRRKGEAGSKLRTREADAETVATQLEGYEDLDSKAETLEKAEGFISEAQTMESSKLTLESIVETLRAGNELLEGLRSEASQVIPDISEIEKLQTAKTDLESLVATITQSRVQREELRADANLVIPDIAEIEKLQSLKIALSGLVTSIEQGNSQKIELQKVVQEATSQIEELEHSYKDTLQKEGTCPTCGTTVT